MECFEYPSYWFGAYDIGRVPFCLVGEIHHCGMAADICGPSISFLHRHGVRDTYHAHGRHAGNPREGKSSPLLKQLILQARIISLTLPYPYDNSLVFSKAGAK